MGFWWALFYWFATTILAELFRKSPEVNNAQPAGLGDFNFPTASESRVVPLVWGTVRLQGPNVIWYGDLENEAITDRVGGGWFTSGTTVTLGYKYLIGVQLGLCRGPIDEVRKIWIGEDIIWQGTFTTDGGVITIDEPEFFGGTEGPSANGGFQGDFRFHFGENNQAANGYLGQFQSPLCAYRNMTYAVLEKGYVGNSASVQPWSFEVGRFPNQLGLISSKERIGEDCNPVAALYEVFTDTRWGVGIDTVNIATAEWVTAAETIFDEGLGFSMILDSVRERSDLVGLLLDHMDAVVYSDVQTQELRLTLVRRDYDVGTLPHFDQTNITELRFTQGSYEETANQVAVQFKDRARQYTDRIAFAQDAANLEVQQVPVTATESYPGAKTAAIANMIAAREMRSKAIPIAQGSFKVNRDGSLLNPGDVFILDWPDWGISDLVCRAQQLRPGTANDGRIAVDFLQDNYGIEVATYAPPQPTGWVPPATEPVAAVRERLWEIPYQLAPDGGRYIVALASRQSGLQIGYEVWADLAGGVDYDLVSSTDRFTPSGLLDGGIGIDLGDAQPYRHDIRVDSLIGANVSDIVAAGSVTVDEVTPANLILIDDEVCWFESVTDNLDGTFDLVNVHRGALDTLPAAHIDNSVLYFFGLGAGLVSQSALPAEVTDPNVKLLTYTDRGVLDLGDAATLTITLAERFTFPIPVGDPQVNGNLIVDLDGWTSTAGTLRFTWNTRNRIQQPLDTKQQDASVSPPGSTRTTLVLRRVDTDAPVVTQSNIPGSSFTTQGFVPESPAGVAAEVDFYFTLDTLRNGVAGPQWVSREFAVFGYGIDYGSNYAGGAGGTGGIVLDQSGAPFVPDPLPGLANARQWALTVGGTYSLNDELRLEFTVNDTLQGDRVEYDQLLDGSFAASLEEYAEDIEGQLITKLDGRAFTMTRNARVVTITTRYGSVTLRQFAENAPRGTSPTVTVKQAAAAPQVPVRQVIYLDYWLLEQDSFGLFFDALAPAQDDNYLLGGPANTRNVITPLTYQAELDMGRSSVNMQAFVQFVPSLFEDRYFAEFPLFADTISNTTGSEFMDSVNPNTLFSDFSSPMTRQALVITFKENYRAREQFFETVDPNNPTPYRLLWKEARAPIGGNAAGLPKIYEISFFTEEADFTGLTYSVIVDGNRQSRTVAATGIAGIIAALELLAADITANVAGISAFRREEGNDNRYLMVLQGGANIDYTATANATFGVEVKFVEVFT